LTNLEGPARKLTAGLFGVLLVTASVLGAVAWTNPSVSSLDGAADQVVQRGEGQVAAGVGIAVGVAAYYVYDNYIEKSPNVSAMKKQDALETKQAIYDQASIQKQNNQLTNTAYGNYLNDTTSIALMEGKNAYIRALENGSTESVARNQAKRAVADYYAVKQQNLIAAWNTSMIVVNSTHNTAVNSSGVPDNFVTLGPDPGSNIDGELQFDFQADTLSVNQSTLVNGTTAETLGLNFEIFGATDTIELTTGRLSDFDNKRDVGYARVLPPTDNQDELELIRFENYAGRWLEIQQQNDEVQAQIDTFINGTYDSYQRGEINVSNLVDPYLGAREFGPENATKFQSWTLQTLSAMGLNTPENLSNVGRMNVTTGGVTYTGILMSDENPAGGFEVGATYNASKLDGSQFVALDGGGNRELEGTFTLASAETTQGDVIQKNESITYRNVTYETADTEEFKELQQELDLLKAEIEARQQRLRNQGGSGIFDGIGFGGLGGLGAVAPVVLVAGGAAVLLLGRN
jgi:hypothetical protein